jgi:hypothetical protein
MVGTTCQRTDHNPLPSPTANRLNTVTAGHPLDEVQRLECKLILKPDRFTAAKVFLDYGKLVAKTAKEFGVGFTNKGVVLKPAIREVVFLDTADFRLYNNAFLTTAHRLRIRPPGGRAGNRFQVSPRRHAEGTWAII